MPVEVVDSRSRLSCRDCRDIALHQDLAVAKEPKRESGRRFVEQTQVDWVSRRGVGPTDQFAEIWGRRGSLDRNRAGCVSGIAGLRRGGRTASPVGRSDGEGAYGGCVGAAAGADPL